MRTDTVWAIVPVNVLNVSKVRLASRLNALNRRRLSEAMLLDVLRALRNVAGIHRIIVVSADETVRRLVKPLGARFLWEGQRRGLNKGLRLAVREAVNGRASTTLILPSDVPLATAREIRRFLTIAGGNSVAIIPSKDGYGTNALLLRPPNVIRPAFGKNSFHRHLSIAKRKGISPRVVKLRGIALDVDEPADLAYLRQASLRSETGRILRSLND